MLDVNKPALHTMLGNYPITKALKSGDVRADLVEFDFAEVKVANNQFKGVVRDAKYDVAELAIVTYLQAKAYGKPYVLIPAVLVSRGQHHTIAYNGERGTLKPSDLNGKRVGLRAYTVTTATWVRRILASDYGVDLGSIDWLTFEDPHVAEYSEPPVVKRAPAGKELAQMLLAGEIDAAVVGDKLPDPRLKHLIPDHETSARAWAERHGGMPINHMAVVRESLSRERPDVVRAVFRALHASKRAAGLPDGGPLDPYRFGVEACRPILEVIIDFCWRQHLMPRPLTVDELFDDTTRNLTI
jgi:4,5-dihydroxyphthalate decarboxylase